MSSFIYTVISCGLLLGVVDVWADAQLEARSLLKTMDKMNNYYQSVQEKLPGSVSNLPSEQQDEQINSEKQSPRALLLPGVPSTTALSKLDSFVVRQNSSAGDSRRMGYREGKRNPFAPTTSILRGSQSTASNGYNLEPLQQAIEIPRMHLKGLITEGSNDMAALLEIENAGTYIVREGDTVGLYESGSNSVIRVKKINRLNLVVEAGSLGQILIVR